MFCRHCGKELPEDSAFCLSCGESTGTAVPGPEPTKHKVTIFRTSQLYLLNPPVNISINGVTNSSIENGGTRELLLAPGHYCFEFSCSFRSRTVEVELSGDIQITLTWSRLTGSLKADLSPM